MVTLGALVQDGRVFVVKIMHGANLTEKAKEEVRLRMLLCMIDCIPGSLLSHSQGHACRRGMRCVCWPP